MNEAEVYPELVTLKRRFAVSKIKYSVLLAALVVLFPALAGANSLAVTAAAALTGSVGTACGGNPCGLEVQIVDQDPAYVVSTHPDGETNVVITFRIDPNDLVMPKFGAENKPGRVRVLKAYRTNAPARQHLFVTLKRNKVDDAYRMAVLQRNNNGDFTFVGEFFLGNKDNEIKIEWTQGNPGTVTVYRDGNQKAQRTTTNFANYDIDEVRMGAVGGDAEAITPGLSGSYYLDEYISTR